jgi:hypothetical protein
MDAAHMQRRIDVVIVTTRAAASSLQPGGGDARAAVRRGLQLLDGIGEEVGDDGDAPTRQRLAEAQLELESLLEGGDADD